MQADFGFGMGVSLLKREDESLQDYFLSFSPFAPFFGVPWRFAPKAMTSVRIEAPEAKAPAVKPAAKPVKAEDAVVVEATVAAAPAPAAKAPAEPPVADDLTAIKGIGPKLSAQLNEMGLFTFAQIAALTDDDIARIDARLTGVNKGSAVRNDWVGQAKGLVSA